MQNFNFFFFVILFEETSQEFLAVLDALDSSTALENPSTDVENQWISSIRDELQRCTEEYYQRQRWISGCTSTTNTGTQMEYSSSTFCTNEYPTSSINDTFITDDTAQKNFMSQHHHQYASADTYQYTFQDIEYDSSTAAYNGYTNAYAFSGVNNNQINNDQSLKNACVVLQTNLTHFMESLSQNPAIVDVLNYNCQKTMSRCDNFVESLIHLNDSLTYIQNNSL